jgi:ubiquinone/menaquinone biosynthesis C-methylase UbiE
MSRDAATGGSAAARTIATARRDADAEGAAPQARNRLWWERLPMTYADWSAERRIPATAADFAAVRALLLDNSPYLRARYDFAAQRGRRVLDLGCGSGVCSCLFAEAGAAVTAVDLTEAAVGLAARGAAVLGAAIDVVRGDAERLGFRDGAFDYVFSWGVLHHTSDTDRAFREVARVLGPGGRGLVMVYHRSSVVYYLKGLYWLVAKGKVLRGHGLRSVQDFYTDGYYHRHYTRSELAGALRAAGLTEVRTTVTQMEKKILPRVPARIDAWLKDRFGWLLIAEFAKAAP